MPDLSTITDKHDDHHAMEISNADLGNLKRCRDFKSLDGSAAYATCDALLGQVVVMRAIPHATRAYRQCALIGRTRHKNAGAAQNQINGFIFKSRKNIYYQIASRQRKVTMVIQEPNVDQPENHIEEEQPANPDNVDPVEQPNGAGPNVAIVDPVEQPNGAGPNVAIVDPVEQPNGAGPNVAIVDPVEQANGNELNIVNPVQGPIDFNAQILAGMANMTAALVQLTGAVTNMAGSMTHMATSVANMATSVAHLTAQLAPAIANQQQQNI